MLESSKDYETEAQDQRRRRRPRKTWKEALRKDLDYLELEEGMEQNQAQLHSRIHIAHLT